MTARSLFVLFGVLCTTSLAAMSLPNTVRRGASRPDQTAPPLAVDVTAADIGEFIDQLPPNRISDRPIRVADVGNFKVQTVR